MKSELLTIILFSFLLFSVSLANQQQSSGLDFDYRQEGKKVIQKMDSRKAQICQLKKQKIDLEIKLEQCLSKTNKDTGEQSIGDDCSRYIKDNFYLKDQINELIKKSKDEAKSFGSTLNTIKYNFKSQIEKMQDKLMSSGNDVKDSFRDHINQWKQQFQSYFTNQQSGDDSSMIQKLLKEREQKNDQNSKLKNKINQLIEKGKNQANSFAELKSKFELQIQKLQQQLKLSKDQAVNKINDEIVQPVKDQGGNFVQKMKSLKHKIGMKIQELSEKIKRSGSKAGESVTKQLNLLKTRLFGLFTNNAQENGQKQIIQQASSYIQQKYKEQIQKLQQQLKLSKDQAVNKINDEIVQPVKDQGGNFVQKMKSLKHKIGMKIQELSEKIKRSGSQAGESVTEQLNLLKTQLFGLFTNNAQEDGQKQIIQQASSYIQQKYKEQIQKLKSQKIQIQKKNKQYLALIKSIYDLKNQ